MPPPTIETPYRRRRLVLAVLCLSVLLTVVSNMALNVALPTLDRQLHAGVSSLAWVVDAYVLSIAAAYFALFGMYFVFTQYFQLVRGFPPLAAGLYALPAGLAQLAVANLAKPLVARRGLRPVLVGGLAASAGGLLILATARPASPMWAVEIGLGLLGVGIGLTMPPATGAIMSCLPPQKAGVGSAVNDLARELGGAFGIGVLGSLYGSGLDRSMIVGAVLVAAAAIVVHRADTGK